MNIIILLIICVAMATQIIGAADKQMSLELKQYKGPLKKTALFIFQSDNDSDQPHDQESLEKMSSKKIQDRSYKQYISSTKHPILLQNNYQWHKIGKASSDSFERTDHEDGCIKWQQLPTYNAEKEESITHDYRNKKNSLITLEAIRASQESMERISIERQEAYEKAEEEKHKLYYQETFGIITPITALTASKKEQNRCRACLTAIEESEKAHDNTISRLKKVLPLDLLQLLSSNPDIKSNLFSLLQVQNQQESLGRKKQQTSTRLEALIEQEKKEVALLQEGIINFDRSALSDEQLRQKARLEKIRAMIDENPELNASDIQLTDDEYASFVFNHRKNLVLGNILAEEELRTIQLACPKILTPITTRTIVAKFDEKISKPFALDSSDTEEENDDQEQQTTETVPLPSSRSASSSSSSSYFTNWW